MPSVLIAALSIGLNAPPILMHGRRPVASATSATSVRARCRRSFSCGFIRFRSNSLTRGRGAARRLSDARARTGAQVSEEVADADEAQVGEREDLELIVDVAEQ